jgi:hypothetical protein
MEAQLSATLGEQLRAVLRLPAPENDSTPEPDETAEPAYLSLASQDTQHAPSAAAAHIDAWRAEAQRLLLSLSSEPVRIEPRAAPLPAAPELEAERAEWSTEDALGRLEAALRFSRRFPAPPPPPREPESFVSHRVPTQRACTREEAPSSAPSAPLLLSAPPLSSQVPPHAPQSAPPSSLLAPAEPAAAAPPSLPAPRTRQLYIRLSLDGSASIHQGDSPPRPDSAALFELRVRGEGTLEVAALRYHPRLLERALAPTQGGAAEPRERVRALFAAALDSI